MRLSVTQAAVVVATVVALTIITALGKLDGTTLAIVLSTLAGNALGYVNGKAVVHKEVVAVATAAKEIAKVPD